MSREAAKEKRRQQVLAAVEASIRREGAVSFSMRELAQEANVSFATPFNLFGSKDEILLALFNKRIVEQAAHSADRVGKHDALENLLHIAASSCEAYLADAELYRPLAQAFRVQNSRQLDDAAKRAYDLWTAALEACLDASLLRPSTDIDALARKLHIAFRMALWMWASEQIADADFQEQSVYATAACILPNTTDAGRSKLHELLDGR